MYLLRHPFLAAHRYLFFQLGNYVYNYPNYFSYVIVCICIFLSLGLQRIHFKDNFRDGYFLRDSKSVAEHNKFLQFYNYTKMPYMMALIGECVQPGCSMLKDEYITEMKNEAIRGLQTVLPPHDFYNSHFQSLQKFLIYSSEIHFSLLEKYAKSPNSTKIVLQYPYLSIGSMHLSVQHIIYGSSKGSVFSLRFLMIFNTSNLLASDIIKAAELQWYQQLTKGVNPKVKLYLLGDELVNYEIQKAALSTIFYFTIGASLMIAVVYVIIRQYGQKRNVNILLTFMTIFCPTLAGTAVFGLLSLMDLHINSMMMITPFLVLGVGVDDSFLLMQFWFYSQPMSYSRLHGMYTTIGPSITLSSFTNVAAFLVGYVMSPSMDIARFCLCSAAAFALCWLVELFVFTPQLLLCCPGKVSLNKNEGFYMPKRYFKMYNCFLQKFSFIHIAILLLLFASLGSCIFMIVNMEENFAPEKIFDDNSFLAKSLASMNKIYGDHQMVRILVTELPTNAITLRADIARITSFHYLCHNYTTWLELYEQLYHPLSTDIQEYFSQLPSFIKRYPETAYYLNYNHKNNALFSLNKISFELCLQGFGKWRDRATVVNGLRRLLPNGYSMFFYDSHILDLILSIKKTILEAVMITVAITAIICFFFLPMIRIAICTILSLLSIIILVMGGLRFWGAELDVVLMVNVVMAAGFTVDYVSHISYHLFLEAGTMTNQTERMARTLHAIFGPTAQATITTTSCIIPLLFHNVYMYAVFAKTVLLCSIFGFLHAVFVVPFLISLVEMVVPSNFKERRSTRQSEIAFNG
ncbi:Patched family protein [Acanthocheilonema viteae]